MADETTPAKKPATPDEYSIDPTALEMLEIAEEMHIETAFTRSRSITPCSTGAQGSCCKVCAMGPCRLIGKHDRGVCGATRSTVAARNFLRQVAVAFPRPVERLEPEVTAERRLDDIGVLLADARRQHARGPQDLLLDVDRRLPLRHGDTMTS